MIQDLIGKNILLISPRYFNYENEIQKELEQRGAFVYFIDDRIKNSTLNKAFFRLKLGETLGKKKVFNYFKTHLTQTSHIKFDYLIAIVPEGFSKEIISHFKEILKETVFILYMWDSFENRPHIVDTLPLFDKAFSFDKSNSVKYGLNFRPLFYTKAYQSIGDLSNGPVSTYKYNLSFIGTAHSDRYNIIQKLLKTSKVNLNKFFLFYLQSPGLIAYYWITDPAFRNIKIKDLTFKSMSKAEVLTIITDTACVIDVNHPKQTGLTIRTLEVLGAKRKLITTNRDVLNYDFYNSNNIYIIDRDNPVLDNEFLEKEYEEIEDAIYNKYSLSSWINDILSLR